MLSPNPTARLQWHDELTTAQMERSDHVHRTRGEGLFVDKPSLQRIYNHGSKSSI